MGLGHNDSSDMQIQDAGEAKRQKKNPTRWPGVTLSSRAQGGEAQGLDARSDCSTWVAEMREIFPAFRDVTHSDLKSERVRHFWGALRLMYG